MEYTTRISWKRNELSFNARTYDRTHFIYFSGGSAIQASSAPEFVGNPQLANPEELFIASISSCFMLTFLYWAGIKGLSIDEYAAEAIGTLAKNSEGKMAVTEVILKPKIFFTNVAPDAATLDELFKKAHENCFISASVKSKITIEREQATA